MTGDINDLVSRLKATLPARWFPDETPVLDAVLTGLSNAWTGLYSLLVGVGKQTRIATVTDDMLDGVSADFFGDRLPRLASEPDTAFRARVQTALVREHATRPAVTASLQTLTGFVPVIFEPARVTDTGAYGSSVLAYGTAGAWGNLDLPFQVFVKTRRPLSAGIGLVAGYGTAGPLVRTNLSQIPGQLTDKDIAEAVTSVLPTAAIAWLNITN